MASGLEARILDLVVLSVEELRARRATARLVWDGEERMRAIPVPCCC